MAEAEHAMRTRRLGVLPVVDEQGIKPEPVTGEPVIIGRRSRHQPRIAARTRELVDHGTRIEAACRILDDQFDEARRLTAAYRRSAESANPTAAA